MNFLLLDNGLQLRSFSLTDANQLFQVVIDNREHLSPWMNWVNQYSSVEDARAFIRYCTREYQEGRAQSFGIWEGSNLLGEVSFTYLDKVNDLAHIGYWLSKDAIGKGLIHKSLTKLINYGFEHLNLHRIEIRTSELNTKSIKVAEALDFEKEAVLKEAGKQEEAYFDVFVYAKIKS